MVLTDIKNQPGSKNNTPSPAGKQALWNLPLLKRVQLALATKTMDQPDTATTEDCMDAAMAPADQPETATASESGGRGLSENVTGVHISSEAETDVREKSADEMRDVLGDTADPSQVAAASASLSNFNSENSEAQNPQDTLSDAHTVYGGGDTPTKSKQKSQETTLSEPAPSTAAKELYSSEKVCKDISFQGFDNREISESSYTHIKSANNDILNSLPEEEELCTDLPPEVDTEEVPQICLKRSRAKKSRRRSNLIPALYCLSEEPIEATSDKTVIPPPEQFIPPPEPVILRQSEAASCYSDNLKKSDNRENDELSINRIGSSLQVDGKSEGSTSHPELVSSDTLVSESLAGTESSDTLVSESFADTESSDALVSHINAGRRGRGKREPREEGPVIPEMLLDSKADSFTSIVGNPGNALLPEDPLPDSCENVSKKSRGGRGKYRRDAIFAVEEDKQVDVGGISSVTPSARAGTSTTPSESEAASKSSGCSSRSSSSAGLGNSRSASGSSSSRRGRPKKRRSNIMCSPLLEEHKQEGSTETPEAVKLLLTGASGISENFLAEHPDMKLLLQDESIADYLRETPPDTKPVAKTSHSKKVRRRSSNTADILAANIITSPDGMSPLCGEGGEEGEVVAPLPMRRSRRVRRKSIDLYRENLRAKEEEALMYTDSPEPPPPVKALAETASEEKKAENQTEAALRDSISKLGLQCSSDVASSPETTPVATPTRSVPNTPQSKRKRKRKLEPSVEDIYLNKLWRTQMPKDKSWETIFELPKTSKSGAEALLSAKRLRRSVNFDDFYVQSRLKSRRQRAKKRGWKPMTVKKAKVVEKILDDKLAELDEALMNLEEEAEAEKVPCELVIESAAQVPSTSAYPAESDDLTSECRKTPERPTPKTADDLDDVFYTPATSRRDLEQQNLHDLREEFLDDVNAQ